MLIASAPVGFPLEMPAGAILLTRTRKDLDVILLFALRAAEVERRFGKLAASLRSSGRLWIAWPKRASKVPTDLTFETVQRIGLAAGLVDNKSASIDEVFQGLQFVYRLKDRPR